MPGMRVLADQHEVARLVGVLAEGLGAAMARRPEPWALVGLKRRGDVLAHRLAPLLDESRLAGRVGSLDITLYRDDLSEVGPNPLVRTTEVPFALDGLQVALVDDVLMTGRSIRAALQCLMDLGRPARVYLAVLVDRGGRELPIEPGVVALDLARSAALRPTDRVEVHLAPIDPQDRVVLQEVSP